ncbi:MULTISPECIES: Mor transcription activator family protein [unclassified Marinimicrobium]|uniref:Mor transcription activator family protein n=1 Tax=unclassified Marinimicrobium TaxID=2632100 RepID=UPI00257FE892|nr:MULTISPECIES: Mor transcription activator family protein [unclassified Marinimicrobium]
MSDQMEHLRHQLLSEAADRVARVLREFNIPEDRAEQCGSAVADDLAQHWAGQNITIPKDYRYKLTQRDLEIWDKFNGRNHLELAREYDLTVNAIYRIAKRIRKRAISRQQPDIFDKASH